MKYTIAVAGTGYVGLSLAVLLAQNHTVYAVDVIKEKVRDIVLKELQQHKLTPLSERNIQRLLLDYLI